MSTSKKIMILLAFLLWFFPFSVFGQSNIIIPIDIELRDLKEIDRRLKECDIDRRELELRKQESDLKDQRIANLEKELDLTKQEIVLKDKIIEVKDMEILATRRALTDMTQVADRAIKLSETVKPKSNTLLYIISGILAGLVAGLAIAL